MKDVVSLVTCENVLQPFFLEPPFIASPEAVSAAYQVKLSTLVKAAWHYNILFPRSQKLQTHRQTDTHTHTHTHGIQLLI